MGHKMPAGYEKKFNNFIQMCQKTKADGIKHLIVDHPQVLGDTYRELVESLSRVSESGLTLHIVNSGRD